MSHTSKTLPQSQVELVITVKPEEYEADMKKAAIKISNKTAIKGFRKGKAPYDIIKKEVGEMAILQEALETIVQRTFYAAAKEEDVETIGMPQIDIEKIAPGNDLVYKAIVALLPKVELADLDKIKISKKTKEVTDKEADEMLENLTKMQAKEVVKSGASTKDDMVLIDMDLKQDGVPVEGGQAKDYRVYLSEEGRHIPGFNEQLIGVKKDDEKSFELTFPKEYYQKNLAGKPATFEIKVKDVFERQFPAIDDEFAKSLGQKSLEDLKALLKKNLEAEEAQKAEQKLEIEIFDTLIEKSKFDEIPVVIVDAERKKMFYELQRDLDRHGISVEKYMADIKKTEEELFEDFKTQATKRAKASLLSRHVATENNITVSDEELEKEIETMKQTYKDDPQAMENLGHAEVKDTIRNVLANKKVTVFLKEKFVGEEKASEKVAVSADRQEEKKEEKEAK